MQLFNKKNISQLLLAILFVLYLIMGYPTPEPVASLIDTLIGKIVVAFVFLSLFAVVNPVLGILGLLVAFQLIRSSGITTGSAGLDNYVPTEEKKSCHLTAYNQFPHTLEQEIVKKMTPSHKNYRMDPSATYKPVLDNLHDATPIQDL